MNDMYAKSEALKRVIHDIGRLLGVKDDFCRGQSTQDR